MRASPFLRVRNGCALIVALGVFGMAQARNDAADRSVTIEKNTQGAQDRFA